MILKWINLFALIFSLSFASAAGTAGFQPTGRCSWDTWFAEDAGIYHVFFLEAPKYLGENIHGNSMVGHATSENLLDWNYEGPALSSARQSWNNKCIATGSVAKYGDKWHMLFSGWSWSTGQSGLGLAVSDDLFRWEKFEQGPVINADDIFESEYNGETYRWIAHRDPYIYPQQIDGWYYAVVCAQIKDVPEERAGALAMIRSCDMVSWEPYKIISFPGYLQWMETPQIWRHEKRWYMYFGAVRNNQFFEANKELVPEKLWNSRLNNCYFVSDDFDGLFGPLESGEFLVSAPLDPGQWAYIFKFLKDPFGRDVAVCSVEYQVSNPFLVNYNDDGSIRLSKYEE